MAKINFDYNKIQSSVLPNISSAIDSLRNAYRRSSIPNSFSYASFLSNLYSTLNSSRSGLMQTQNWLNSCNRNYERIIESTKRNFSYLETPTVSKRETIVR